MFRGRARVAVVVRERRVSVTWRRCILATWSRRRRGGERRERKKGGNEWY
jgi:hypothetical protein